MGGQGSEIMNRYREAGLGPAMIPIAMMAMTILPLTMVGLEVREAVKYGMGGVLPGVPADPSVFKTDDMDSDRWDNLIELHKLELLKIKELLSKK